MSKILGATLLGAVSILMLAGLGVSQPSPGPQLAAALPALAADAARSDSPRECSVEHNVQADCTY